MIPVIAVHPCYFYLLDLKLIIFWHSPGSGECISSFQGQWVFHKKKQEICPTANAYRLKWPLFKMLLITGKACYDKGIDKGHRRHREVTVRQQCMLTEQQSLCIDPSRVPSAFRAVDTSGNKKLHFISMMKKQRNILGVWYWADW